MYDIKSSIDSVSFVGISLYFSSIFNPNVNAYISTLLGEIRAANWQKVTFIFSSPCNFEYLMHFTPPQFYPVDLQHSM